MQVTENTPSQAVSSLSEGHRPVETMLPVRVLFTKTGRAKYTSHLDTMRTMTRAFKRSGLPLWYTQGFNPHLYSTFPLPIALGYESVCETVDIRLVEAVDYQHVVERLNRALPPGLEAMRAAAPEMEPAKIAWADYAMTLRRTNGGEVAAALARFLEQPEINVVKKTKKGEKVLDIKPLSQLLHLEGEGEVAQLSLRLASGITLNINPTLFLGEFYTFLGGEQPGVRIVRERILTAEGEDFR